MSDNSSNQDLPDLSGSRAILDTNIFISKRKDAHSFLRAIGNPEVFHTEIIFKELLDVSKRYGLDEEEVFRQVNELFHTFGSTMLPKTGKPRKIARRISGILKLAGLQKEKVKEEKNDTLIVAYTVISGIDVVTRDALFYVIGKIFTTGITVHLVYEKLPDAWSQQMKTRLKKKGIKTPVDLTHLIDKRKKQHTPRKKAEEK